jgi:hypothetical protein
MRFTDSLASTHNGSLSLPPSTAALNPDQKGLALTEDGYDNAVRSGRW